MLQGTGIVATGGTVVSAVTSADGNVHGSDIAGGTPQHVVPGDLMIVPEGVSHILESDANVPLIVATLHLPRAAAALGNMTDTQKLVHQAADLAAMVARAKNALSAQPHSTTTLLSLPPYNVEMEYISAKSVALLHKHAGEFLYVLEGEGEVVTDGSLVNPHDRGSDIDGDDIQGGNDHRLKQGDFVYVPKNVSFLSRTSGTFVLATLQVPSP